MPTLPTLDWDLYCRVVDNYGDAGVCWRLAADLAARGHRVRLVIDDTAPLAFMAPQGADRVEVQAWPGAGPLGDVVVEAFGCTLPPEVTEALSSSVARPFWINLEYLSAEPYVERSHGLPSPQHGGICKWFYYPGFSERTGGLLREHDLLAQRAAFDRHGWLERLGLRLCSGERVVSLFCYDNPALPALLRDLAQEPTLLLLTQGMAQRQIQNAPHGVRLHPLPWLDQPGFDRMLWASDLNVVRGEDSLVRALWAGSPLIWQAYPQDDGAHIAKVEALMTRLQLPSSVAAVWRTWNGFGTAQTGEWPGLPGFGAWQRAAAQAHALQASMPDLCSQLCAFVHDHRGGSVARNPGRPR